MEERIEIAEERESSGAKIRTLFNEQRTNDHHVARKFLITNSKQLEQNNKRKILQGELSRLATGFS